MKNAKSEPIGECKCPRPDCAERVQIFRYVERSARPSMFKGKFHGRCAVHGAVIQASDKPSQEHVLNTEGAIWGATDIPKTEPAPSPAPAARSTPTPASKSAAPAQQPTPKPATSTAVVPSPTPEPVRPARGWNLTDWWAELFG